MRIDVSSSGAVLLGDKICCDGFFHDHKARIQTHFHHDHMIKFNSSKAFQDIFMSEPTFSILNARYNADLPDRKGENIFILGVPGKAKYDSMSIEFYDSRHMLGAVQVAVQLDDGYRVGYSGDFSWPLEPDQVMQVDELVIDATYGSPDSIRKFTIEEVKDRFRGLVAKYMKNYPIEIRAHGGTLQHALSCLDDLNDWPIITEKENLKREICVYQVYGYSISRPIFSIECERELARETIKEKKFIRIASLSDFPSTNPRFPTFNITALYRSSNDSITELGADIYAVPISDHADFNGTLAYVEATGAKKVMCDNIRPGHAADLAVALKKRLGIDAVISKNHPSYQWGV